MREKLKDGGGGSCHMRSSTQSSPLGVASGYAPGQIKICICLQAIPQAIYSTIFDLRGPRRRLRLCPRANKNLHIPAGYAQSILLHNICLQGDMQIFICFQAMPKAFPQYPAPSSILPYLHVLQFHDLP
ncbi:hypothetical protein T08_6801 [Trichinella sp. T8]|nr:hypothetical protein T08_6801 [Trichinella sp. T8]